MENKTRARIIGTEWCPFCTKAKNVFDKANVQYEWIDSDEKPEVRAKYKTELNFNTVPMIWVDDKFIGGFSELQGKIRNGSVKL